MAKKTLWQRIKAVFSGNNSAKSSGSSGSSKRTNYYSSSRKDGGRGYYRRSMLNSLTGKGEEEEPRYKSMATATKSESQKQTSSFAKLDSALKKDVPDPKRSAALKSKENAKDMAASVKKWNESNKQQKKEFNERTNHKYDVKYWEEKGDKKKAQEARIRVKSGENVSDIVAEELAVKYHPTAMSAARGAASGATFGASELAIKAQAKRDKERAKNEQYYQEHKNKYAEGAGEFVGALASFGATAGATEKLGAKAVSKVAPRAAERLAEKKVVQGLAKRGVNKAVKKGLVSEATEELIKQAGKKKAEKIVSALGNDIVQNLTTGAIYDINKASAQHEVGSKDWWKELGTSAALNFAVTGGIAGGAILGGNKKAAVEAAGELTKNNAAIKKAQGQILGKAMAGERALDRSFTLPEENIRIKDLVENTQAGREARRADTLNTLRSNAEANAPRSERIGLRKLTNIDMQNEIEAQFRLGDIETRLDDAYRTAGDPTISPEVRQEAADDFTSLLEQRKFAEDDLANIRTSNYEAAMRGEPVTRQPEIRTKQAEPQAVKKPSEVMQGYSSKGSKRKLADVQKRAKSLIANGDTDGARREIEKAVDEIVRDTRIVEPLDETTKEIKSLLKDTRVSVSNKVDAGYLSGGYNEFRKQNFGTLKLTEDGTPVDDLWLSLQERYGTGMFPDEIANPSDQLQYLADITKAKDNRLALADDELLNLKNELTDSLWKAANESPAASRKGAKQAAETLKPKAGTSEEEAFVSRLRGDERFEPFARYDALERERDEIIDSISAVGKETEEQTRRLDEIAREMDDIERANGGDNAFYENRKRTANSIRQDLVDEMTEDAWRDVPPTTKGTKPAAENLRTQQARNADDNFAAIKDDVSDLGFSSKNEEIYQASKKVENAVDDADIGKSEFDKLKDKAYSEAGVDLNTDNVEKMNVGEQRQFFDAEWRTKEEHTKRGFSTIAVTGDKGFKGIAYDALKNGETVVDVYHDKENLAKGAQRVMAKADQEGGVQQMIKDFNDYANNKLRLTENERRDQIYDLIAAVDFANANKDQPWSGDLFLAACRAGGEQTSGSGLSLHMWHKMAMSSPAHRAKAVREQILDMFNRSAGMRKALEKGKGNKLTIKELDDVLKKNEGLKKVLDELDKMDEATSKDEVEKVASKALIQARKAMPMTVLDQLTQWRYVAMLSSPKTHIRNIVSNIHSATLGQVRDAIASATEDNLIKGKGKYGKKFKAAVESGKIDESNYHKSAGGLSWKAFKDSHSATKQGFTLDRMTSRLEKLKLELESTPAKDADKIAKITGKIKDLEARIPEAQKAFDEATAKIERGTAKKALESWRSMGKEELVNNIEKFEHRQYNGTVSKGVFKVNDKLSHFIGDALETSDALSLERIYREKYDKILMANGWDELSKRVANGDKAAEKAIKQLEEYAAQEASYTAALDTYRNYNALSTAMNRFINDSLFNYDAPIYKKAAGAALHAIMPFTKVPVNLLKRGLDYSPVGLMTAKRNLMQAIEAGDITQINRACERLAEGRIGTGVVMLGAGLGFADADGDLITGRLHDTDYIDKKKKDAGVQNYSVTLGDSNFTLDWATPTAASLFTGVEFGRMLRHAYDQLASDNGLQFDFWKAFDVPMILASTTLEPTLQLGVFQGINDTLESVVKSDNYDDSGTNINPALKIVGSIAGNYVNSQISPALLSSLNRAFSPYDYFVTGDTTAEYNFNQQLAKMPILSEKFLGAKTNVWGEAKNEKTSTSDYVKSAAKNLLSPANINKVTWDDTDEYLADFYKETGYKDAFPKNNYNDTVEVGRIKGEHSLKMNKKEMAEYNQQRSKAGEDAMSAALDTVVFNRYSKDSKGHLTVADPNNMSQARKNELINKCKGKGIKDVVSIIIKEPAFQNATVAEQKAVLAAIYGTNGGDDDMAKGAKRTAQRYIAGKKGMSTEEYDYYNETPRNAQEALTPLIEGGLLTYQQAVDFGRNAGKKTYSTDERGEKGGTVTMNYSKASMMEYLAKMGYSYEEAEALYNAYKSPNAKAFSGIDLSSGSGRRGYGGYRKSGGGGGKAKVPTINAKSMAAATKSAKGTKVKLEPPTPKTTPKVTTKFRKYDI